MEFIKPECHDWGIWEGNEIEGTTDMGVITLFVRRGDPSKYWDEYQRLWFCKEYQDYDMLLKAKNLGKIVALEVTPETLLVLPREVRLSVQLYLKIDAGLKIGDHVCVGTAFKDQAFMIGEGAKVEPWQYSGDRVLEK